MILPDVNPLIYALRIDSPHHVCYRNWLTELISGSEPFAVSPQVLSSVFRVTTNRRIYSRPTEVEVFLAFASSLLEQPHCRIVQPGPRHWSIFCELCRATRVTGNLVQDAWFAALALEHGCEWITEDRDYASFPGLRWRSISQPAVR